MYNILWKMFMFLFLFFSMLLLCSFFRLKESFQVKNGVTTSLLLILENPKNLGCSDDGKRRKKRGWPYLDIFWIQAYAIKCVKKANFGCTWHSRKILSTCKKNLVERLNFKTKVIDDIFKNYSGSCLSFWTYLGETSCILQSSSQRHLHF